MAKASIMQFFIIFLLFLNIFFIKKNCNFYLTLKSESSRPFSYLIQFKFILFPGNL